MHPLFVGRLRIAIYLGLWLAIAAMLAAQLANPARPFGQTLAFVVPLTLVYAFACLSAWWVCRSLPLASTSPTRLFTGLGGATLQASAAWVVLGGLWAAALGRLYNVPQNRPLLVHDLSFLAATGVALYLQSIAVHYLLLTVETARAAERRLLESQVTAREAELKALRAQLNPHFLFNSLNSISALTGSDPEAARRMCQGLGDFLRQSLALGARERVSLGEELALAERYLAIEQIRFGERLTVAREVEPGVERCAVPPLLIQPLIENAVKHGVADRVEGGTIRIEARRRDDLLEIAVENPRDPEAPPRRGQGMGLENVRRRLVALDPRRAGLDVTREPERFRVVVALPVVPFEPDVEATRAPRAAAARSPQPAAEGERHAV